MIILGQIIKYSCFYPVFVCDYCSDHFFPMVLLYFFTLFHNSWACTESLPSPHFLVYTGRYKFLSILFIRGNKYSSILTVFYLFKLTKKLAVFCFYPFCISIFFEYFSFLLFSTVYKIKLYPINIIVFFSPNVYIVTACLLEALLGSFLYLFRTPPDIFESILAFLSYFHTFRHILSFISYQKMWN